VKIPKWEGLRVSPLAKDTGREKKKRSLNSYGISPLKKLVFLESQKERKRKSSRKRQKDFERNTK